jgi:hypothetical protein
MVLINKTDKPEWIKTSSTIINDKWVASNPDLVDKFKELGEKLLDFACSTYLIGSAAGTEKSSRVGDIDVVIFFGKTKDLTQIELLTRPYKHLEGTDLTIRYQLYPKSFINPYTFNTGFNPVYYTAIKTVNHLISGEDILANSNWLDETEVKSFAKMLVIEECLMVFRVINKQKWNSKQNSVVMQKIIDMLLNLMFYKGYFGFSKTELYSGITSEYKLANPEIPNLMLEDRKSGIPRFYEKDPEHIQTECLKFAQEILNLLQDK